MMRVTKKLYALLIAGMMAVSLAGCQSTGNSSNDESTQNEQSSKGSTNSWRKRVLEKISCQKENAEQSVW